jgi:hypothetical protein
VRVTKAGVCGSDMHIDNHGDALRVQPRLPPRARARGRGRGCRRRRHGRAARPEVASSFWISCGECHFCRKGLQTSCVKGGAYGFEPFWPGGRRPARPVGVRARAHGRRDPQAGPGEPGRRRRPRPPPDRRVHHRLPRRDGADIAPGTRSS